MHVSFEPYRNIDGGFKNSRPKSMYEERQRRKVEQNWNDVRRNLDCRGIDRETTYSRISRIVKIIKIGREKFLRQKKSLRANQIKENYFPI